MAREGRRPRRVRRGLASPRIGLADLGALFLGEDEHLNPAGPRLVARRLCAAIAAEVGR